MLSRPLRSRRVPGAVAGRMPPRRCYLQPAPSVPMRPPYLYPSRGLRRLSGHPPAWRGPRTAVWSPEAAQCLLAPIAVSSAG
eukprot:12129176-Prorocentrum_lima.AAC.1